MKALHLAFLLLLLTSSIQAKTVINHPSFEFSNSGVTHIKKIELTRKETKLFIHCQFLPKWWVRFSKKTFIQDAVSGEKYFPEAMEGGDFDKEIFMGASGDSSFVLVFPALPKNVKKIHYGQDDKASIFGLSLNPRASGSPKESGIPARVQSWLDSEHARAKRKTLVDYSAAEFFSPDTARLIGYIKGYDRRAGFNTGMIYGKNEITNEDYPLVVNIHDDGRFEASIPMYFPKHTYVAFQRSIINFYLEPGQTLSMVLNWEEFLTADRLRNIRYRFKDIAFAGPSATINKDLNSVEIQTFDYKELQQAITKQKPDEFKKMLTVHWNTSKGRLEQEMSANPISPQAQAILRSEVDLAYAASMLDFLSNRESIARKDTANKIVRIKAAPDYYDFLKNMNLNDRTLLVAPDFWVFANRFEFTSALITLPDRYSRKPFHVFLFDELKLKAGADDRPYLDSLAALNNRLSKAASAAERFRLVSALNEPRQNFEKKYSKYLNQYETKYPAKKSPTIPERFLGDWVVKDSLLVNYFGLQHNLIYDILKARSLKYVFNSHLKGQKEEARNYLSTLERGMKNESVLQMVEAFYHRSYPAGVKAVYDLPAGKGTEIFRKVIDQYKGKMLFVDFWATSCGPCVASIKANKSVRSNYKGSKDIEFIFLTSAQESPEERYNAFVKEQELQHTYRLSADDFRYLRQLFKFNGIPRYVVINREGQVLNDDFAMHNFDGELKKLLAQQ
ncbi:TlpA disulfide reductase family protein [Pedobacter sp. SYSU D00535]|uniref:TlpA family protein disulfide reductase n=1 Tax=Pedobacter sp. SYSU D00535 TaxID=2810308 RepID=UPI001A9701F8|nr:TlpA disulfide reductase family protein [Pedobacter sp. SYSU D00535]